MRTRILLVLLALIVGMGGGSVVLADLVPAAARAPIPTVPLGAGDPTSAPAPKPTPSPSASPTSPPAASPTTGPGAPAPAPGSKVIHLTFDDGPDPRYTPEVLRILGKYDAKATFFVLGQNAGAFPQLIAQTRQQGHAVASHSFDHSDLTRLGSSGVRDQLERTSRVLGGTRCMRPPYGATNTEVGSVVTGLGQRSVLWDVDTNDWRRPGAATIEQRVVGGARPGAVVLMHDAGGDRGQTVSALEGMLRRLSAQGYTFAPVPGC